MKYQIVFSAIFLFTINFIIGCASAPELTSAEIQNPIAIDGNASDWGTKLKYLKDQNVALGVTNDDEYFYLCLTTADMGKVMPMFAGNFTVWIENEKDDNNTIGIRYPLHNIVNESSIMLNPEQFREKGRGMMISGMIQKQNEIRILNKDNFPVTVISTSDSSGLTARLGYNNDQFVYELRVPLKIDASNKYGINAQPGDKLDVKFETEKPDRSDFGGRGDRDEMRPGGMGGFGNGGGGMRPPGGGGRQSFQPVDFSVDVTLK